VLRQPGGTSQRAERLVKERGTDESSVSETAMKGECNRVDAEEPLNGTLLLENEETWKAGKSPVNGAEVRRRNHA